MDGDASHKTTRLVTGFGTRHASWVPTPRSDDVAQAAFEYVTHRVAAFLREHHIGAGDLARACGGSAPGWRNKLNGARPITVADLVAIAIAIDPAVLNAIPTAQDARDLLPDIYRDRLTHRGGRALGMPRFRCEVPDWPILADNLQAWWRTESAAGRDWALTRDVIVLRMLQELDIQGVRSAACAPGGPATDLARRIVWPGLGLDVTVAALPGERDADSVITAMRLAAEVIWGHHDGVPPERGRLVLLSAVPNSVANIAGALGLENSRAPTLSIGCAARLGLAEAAAQQDILIKWWRYDSGSPFLWLLAKG